MKFEALSLIFLVIDHCNFVGMDLIYIFG